VENHCAHGRKDSVRFLSRILFRGLLGGSFGEDLGEEF
jgi:hypothetical protein